MFRHRFFNDMNELNIDKLRKLAELADELILNKSKNELESLLKTQIEANFSFENDFCKGYFYYILGNCSSEVYKYYIENWYSKNLIDTVNLYHKAVFYLKKNNNKGLLSFALTNLGNYLSAQGRCFCALAYWEQAIEIDRNPVALIAKARNQIFIAHNLFDASHTEIQYFFARKIIADAEIEYSRLENEQKRTLERGGELWRFKIWFDQNYELNSFEYLNNYKQKTSSKVERRYLEWIASHNLFINDLNDVFKGEIVFQDILGLPSMQHKMNSILSLKESLVYHSNFDELRNEFTYARFLIFQASEIKENKQHFYNATYSHVEDTLHAIDNLKTSHLKSAFRILYSIFDKISYFIAKYLDLNIKEHEISFSSIFRSKSKGVFQPRVEINQSNNYFLHALFYILKEIENVVVEPADRFLDKNILRLAKLTKATKHAKRHF